VKLYEILGVDPTASQTEIRQAYKKLAMKLHPDRPNGNAEAFLPVQAAYDVLGDKARRARYDETGDVEDRRFEDLVTDKMMQLFNGMLSEEEDVSGNAVDQMRQMVQRGIEGTDVNRAKIENKKSKLKRRSTRLKITQGHGTNLYKQLADVAIAQCDQQIAQLGEEIDLLEEVLHRIDWYEDMEPVEVVSHTRGWYVTSTSTMA